MMDLRKRLFLGISVVVLIVLAVVLFLLSRSDEEAQPFDETDNEEAAFLDDTLDLTPFVGDPTVISPILANEDADERYVRQLAIDFVERFGSFSNQNRNSHIDDVLPLVTDGMGAWVQTQLLSYSDEYKGSTSQVIVSNIEAFSDTGATVHIESQQALETQTDTERIYNVGTVTLLLEDNEWKVSGLFWE